MGRAAQGIRQALIVGVLLLQAIPAHGQERLLRKPELTYQGEQACMTFEETKQFVMVYKHYTVLYDARIADLEALHAAKLHMAECKNATSSWKAAFKSMKAANAHTEKQRDAAIKEVSHLKKWSVKDGAFPWVVGIVIGSFVAGYLVGK